MRHNPLVSVVVITYNSATTVLETLESIKRQTYPNIEVILSDDGSTDNTVDIADKWINENKHYFVRSVIKTSTTNTGTTKNCNRGVKSANGEFIKLIAGDDLLLSNCIEDLIEYCVKHNAQVAFSKVQIKAETESMKIEKTRGHECLFIDFFESSSERQRLEFLKGFKVGFYLIGAIFTKTIYDVVGGFDENYKMMEDYPFYFRISWSGYKLPLLDKYTAIYRVRGSQNAQNFQKSRRYLEWYENLERFEKKEIFPRMRERKMFFSIYDLYIRRTCRMLQCHYASKSLLFVSKLVLLLSPLFIFTQLRLFVKIIAKKQI